MSKFFYYTRSLFPHWRFFDQVGFEPRLYLHFSSGDNWSAWQEVLENKKWYWLNFFYNPETNFSYYVRSRIKDLILEIENNPNCEIENTEIYKMILDLVKIEIRDVDFEEFQFEIRGLRETKGRIYEDVIITSKTYDRDPHR